MPNPLQNSNQPRKCLRKLPWRAGRQRLRRLRRMKDWPSSAFLPSLSLLRRRPRSLPNYRQRRSQLLRFQRRCAACRSVKSAVFLFQQEERFAWIVRKGTVRRRTPRRRISIRSSASGNIGSSRRASRGRARPPDGPAPEEFVPAFLAKPATESWLARHANLLAIVILLVGIVVAVVVFR